MLLEAVWVMNVLVLYHVVYIFFCHTIIADTFLSIPNATKATNKANTLLSVFQREWMFKKGGREKYSQALKINKTLHSPSGIMCIHDGFFLFAAFTSYLQCLHFLFTAFTFLFAAFNFFLCSVFFLFAAIVCYSQRSLFYLQQFFLF